MTVRLECPVSTCDRARRPDHAMCATCWRQVPADLQRAVYRAWRERQRGYEGATERHLQAVENACAAVEGRDPVDLLYRDPTEDR
jgi:hypothetical protein